MAVTSAVPRIDEDGIAERVRDLRAGTTIRVGGERMLVTGEPMTMHRGLGLFDDFTLLIGIEVQAVDGLSPRRRLVLEPDAHVLVVSRSPEVG